MSYKHALREYATELPIILVDVGNPATIGIILYGTEISTSPYVVVANINAKKLHKIKNMIEP